MAGVSSETLKKFGFDKEEQIQFGQKHWEKTGYPKPEKNYRLILEMSDVPIEQTYYWVVDYLQYDYGFKDIEKITDIFSASEGSAFFGVSQQRLGIQQDKVSQYLATIGKMVKELFQLVRELRIIDERLRFYYDSLSDSKSAKSADISLKGIWIDMVEQGSKNPASVYGLARELGFGTLPDLFFSVHVKSPDEVDEVVDALDFNRKVKEVLKRKLRTYLEWRASTFDELKNKRRFTLKYLRQHFDIIKMYMTWVKPYLRHIKRLTMNQSRLDHPDLVTAFESSAIEIELLFKRKFGNIWGIVMVCFDYRTRPTMSYHQEGYNRGPLHMGKMIMDVRSYIWDDKTLKKYKEMKEHDEMELLGVIDGSVRAAMESLGDELMDYLKQAGEEFPDKKIEEEKTHIKRESALDPFADVFKGFGEIFSAFFGSTGKSKRDLKKLREEIYHDKNKAKKHCNKAVWDTYKNFKKGHKILAW